MAGGRGPGRGYFFAAFLPPRPEGTARYGAGVAGGSFSTLQWNGFAAGGGKAGTYHLG